MNLELLQTMGKVRKYQKGEFVCVENEEGHTAYLLLKGTVVILLKSFADVPRPVAELQSGAIFGEMSLLENKPRNASVVAGGNDTLVLEMKKEDFLKVLQADSEIAYNLLKTLTGRTEKCLDDMKRVKIAYVAEYRRNKHYSQIQNLTKEQFQTIIEQDSNHALRLLTFLSHALAEMDNKLVERH